MASSPPLSSSSSSLTSFVSQEEFNLFHRIDRQLYTILVINLNRDPVESMQIMAFWLWLERVGFRNIVHRMLSLPILLINELAEEAVSCLACISSENPPPSSDVENPNNNNNNNNIPLTQSFMKKEISLQTLHGNRKTAIEGTTKVLNEVCFRALKDIMERAITHRNFNSRPPPPDDRAMFVTFSKGYPVHEWEVREFFTGMYGDCVESFQMQEVEPNEQALFARIVFRTVNTIDMILGGLRRIKFTINGKHLWARKFVPKRSPLSSSPSMLPPYLNQ